MAKKVIRIDDVDGKEIDANFEVPPVAFSFMGKNYEIDLRQANVEKFEKDLESWIKAATEVEEAPRGPGRRPRAASPQASGGSRPNTGSGRSKEELQNIRDWAVKNGHEVSPRGRIAAPILEAYDEAHKPKA